MTSHIYYPIFKRIPMAAQGFEFEHERLVRGTYIGNGNYAGCYIDGFFNVNIGGRGKKNTDGWKIHVSIDDEGEEGATNLAAAWRIVAEELMREEIYAFKIIGADRLPMRDETIKENEQEVSQRAKQITIYSNVDQDKDWRHILQNITDNFIDNGVRPSYLPQGDKAFSGNRFPEDTNPYFSYSYRTKQGNRAEFSPPAGEADPYADIVLNLPQAVNIERKQWVVIEPNNQTAIEPPHYNEMHVAIDQPQPDPADEDKEGSYCCGCRC